MRLDEVLGWVGELAAVAKRDGLRGIVQRFQSGFAFISLVDDAVRPRIVEESRGRAGMVKVDTGLPELGARRFFLGIRSAIDVAIAGVGGAISLTIGLRGIGSFLVSITTEHPPLVAIVVFFAFVVALTLAGVLGVAWALHSLLLASVKANMPLTGEDQVKLSELIQRNSDVTEQATIAPCHDYKQLAQFIVCLRREIAKKDIQRAI